MFHEMNLNFSSMDNWVTFDVMSLRGVDDIISVKWLPTSHFCRLRWLVSFEFDFVWLSYKL